MNKHDLLQLYAADERLKSIVNKLSPPTQTENGDPLHFHFKNLVGSSSAIVAAAFNSIANGSLLIVLNDKEEAAYFQNDLQHFVEKKDVLFLTDSFKKPGSFDELFNSNVQLRTEVINRITNSITKNEIVVTYPEALIEKVVNTAALQKSTLFIKLNEKLDEEFITEMLITYGFERVDFVFEPGQFAIRGGIVDIFSFGNDLPFRIELFGEEVESIRVFDPLSQLSEKKISQVTIVPNIQTQFTDAEKVSVFEIIPANTTIWFYDFKFLKEKIISLNEKATTLFQSIKKLGEDGVDPLELNPKSFFIQPAEFTIHYSPFTTVEFGRNFFFTPDDWLAFDLEPQPSINKNFPLLISYWKKYRKENFTTLLFSDNKNQFNRLTAIFEDLKADVVYHSVSFAIKEGFIDRERKVACYTDHQIFDRYHRFHLKQGFSKSKSLSIKMLRELQPGDYVTHIDHGVGVFGGLEKVEVNGQLQEAVRLVYRDSDLLYVSIQSLHKISKYAGKDATPPKVNKLGTEAWEQLKRKVKAKVKDISKELIALYAKRKATKGFAFSPDSYMQTELESSFIYEDTPDQIKSINDIKRDMEKDFPMDRLICGDVGFGKTEVAIRAAFKAVADGKQVAVLVPTTILAMQHFKTFSERLAEFPCTIDYINRFKSSKQQKEVIEKLTDGKIDIIIGTSSLMGEKVKFKNLGLLIIDEEQKFGVGAKEKLRTLKANVDTLTLTATPIPRTLQFSLMGARDLSIINTAPPNRQPIDTEVLVFDPDKIKEAIEFEVNRGGQVFFIHNRVKDIGEVAGMIKQLCPEIDITVAHGQLEGHILEEKMLAFIERKYDVLVCTNIVESGLDIPNANTIIINDANNFGLSDLHQLRGRVGRSNKKAFCYLVTPPFSVLTSEARKRLKTIEEFADLGSGFQIAMRDMDIRGAGNILGGEQSGFIADIGFDTYHKILDEAIRELKETDYKDLFEEEVTGEKKFVRECTIDSDVEMLIPDHYVSNINERLALYTELDNIEDEAGLKSFEEKLLDRFGPVPREVKELFDGVLLRKIAKHLGFERLQQRRGTLKCYTIENPESLYYDSEIFTQVLGFVSKYPSRCSMRQMERTIMIQIKEVNSMREAKEVLKKIAV
ncbi:MAG: transcription-repair coupling factor [Chitinophagales bacterium]|nr:transcription-repair coupling factor [Chitinophagales bacterium]